MIIDQKRAHERILYEKYTDIFASSGGAESQRSMFPEPMELTPGDYYIVNEIKDELVKCGFEIQDLGNNVISLSTFPASVRDIRPAALLESIIAEYREKQTDPSIGIKEKVALSLSRSAAIPYGKKLSRNEMEDLFDNLFACRSPNYSPTGKPIINIITLEEIDKRLK